MATFEDEIQTIATLDEPSRISNSNPFLLQNRFAADQRVLSPASCHVEGSTLAVIRESGRLIESHVAIYVAIAPGPIRRPGFGAGARRFAWSWRAPGPRWVRDPWCGDRPKKRRRWWVKGGGPPQCTTLSSAVVSLRPEHHCAAGVVGPGKGDRPREPAEEEGPGRRPPGVHYIE